MTTATKNQKPVNRVASALDAAPTTKPEIVTFTIIGISPLLQNNPAMFIGKDGTDTQSLGTKKTYKDDEEAALRVYKDTDGHYYHPAEAFIKSMLRAVSGKKFGKMSAPAIIKGAVFMAEPYCFIENPDGEPVTHTQYTIDRRPCVVGKARILRCRPCWSPWRVRLALDIDTALVSVANVKDALSLAGRTVGVGDYRPEKGGGFGRYRCD